MLDGDAGEMRFPLVSTNSVEKTLEVASGFPIIVVGMTSALGPVQINRMVAADKLLGAVVLDLVGTEFPAQKLVTYAGIAQFLKSLLPECFGLSFTLWTPGPALALFFVRCYSTY